MGKKGTETFPAGPVLPASLWEPGSFQWYPQSQPTWSGEGISLDVIDEQNEILKPDVSGQILVCGVGLSIQAMQLPPEIIGCLQGLVSFRMWEIDGQMEAVEVMERRERMTIHLPSVQSGFPLDFSPQMHSSIDPSGRSEVSPPPVWWSPSRP